MPRSLTFQFGEEELAFELHKVDRTKLYGFKELEAVDDEDRPCTLATLASDGRTLIGRGGTGVGYMTVDGEWCEKSELTPVDLEGEEVIPVRSSFDAPVKLFDTVEADEFLDHNIRLMYQLKPGAGCDADRDDSSGTLRQELERGTVFRFPFSYRGGLEADVGLLLLSEDGDLFVLIGSAAEAEFIELQATTPSVDDTHGSDGDPMDFDMI